MSKKSRDFPERPRSHIVGEIASNSFRNSMPENWILNESKQDYGWDLYVEITEKGQVQGTEFFVQLKGSDNPNYLKGQSYISISLKVSTLKFLLSKPIPSMLALCHTKRNKPVFWVWIEDAVEKIEVQNPNWHTQSSVSLKIPTANTLSPECGGQINDFVRNFFEEKKIRGKIGEIVIGVREQGGSTRIGLSFDKTDSVLEQKAADILSSAGFDVTYEESGARPERLTSSNRKRSNMVREASGHLNAFRDHEAEKILNKVGGDLEKASEGVRAGYLNNKGILSLHIGKDDEALSFFEQAMSLRPNDKKYLANLLGMQLKMASEQQNGVWGNLTENLPKGWTDNLKGLLEKEPNYPPALRLEAHRISETESPEAAEEFLRNSNAWKEENVFTRIYLAEIYKNHGKNEKALKLLEEANAKDSDFPAFGLSLKGNVELRIALGHQGRSDITIPWGLGPTDLNLTYLQKSHSTYSEAVNGYSKIGFPLVSEVTLVNYSTVSGMVGLQEEAIEHCKQFLKSHPENESIHTAIAALLMQLEKSQEALYYLRKLFQSNPNDLTHYKRICLGLMLGDNFEELLELVREQQTSGFRTLEEEGLSRTLTAIAYAEFGEKDLAEQQIQVLKSDDNLYEHGVVAEAEVCKRTTGEKNQALAVYRKGLGKHPNNLFLLSHLSGLLGNPTPENANEVIETLGKIALQRQLWSDEELAFVKAHLIKGNPEKADDILHKAVKRFPKDQRFLFAQSNVSLMLGDEDSAYDQVNRYLKNQKTFKALLEGAILARDTGRLEEATKLFELSLRKTKESEEIGKIHSQLYHLRRLNSAPPKTILRHAVEFGKTTNGEPDKEAQFFMMVLLAPQIPDDEIDQEIKNWYQNTKERIDIFVEQHPKFPSFRRFELKDGLPKSEQINDILSEAISLVLPHEMRSAPFRLAARNKSWPLALRVKFFMETQNLFELWSLCSQSTEFSHGIHIWMSQNNMATEEEVVRHARKVCVDISALLTLAEFDILEQLLDKFETIYLSQGTKWLLQSQHLEIAGPHPLAAKIEKWRLMNLKKVRVRNASMSEKVFDSEISREEGGTIIQKRESLPLDKLIGHGVGETVLLAEKLGVPIYSDEALIRYWGISEYTYPSFCTLSFLKILEERGAISTLKSISLQAGMIQKNFHTIPFSAWHLNEALRAIVREQSGILSSQDLNDHPVLGVYLRQFGESQLDLSSLLRIAFVWWFKIFFDREIPRDYLNECMEGPSFKLAVWRHRSGVMAQAPNEDELTSAGLWGKFLWDCYRQDDTQTYEAWIYIKECCRRVFPHDQGKQRRVLYEVLPESLCKILKKDATIPKNRKLDWFVQLPMAFPAYVTEDRPLLEAAFSKLAFNLK